MSNVPICIDISHHQGSNIDWDQVASSGVLGMIHKATEGTSFIDDMRAENCSQALDAGIAISTYFWIKPGDGRDQANFYLETIEPQRGERVVIDAEEEGLTLDTVHDAVNALFDTGLDLRVATYSGHWAKEALDGGCDEILAKTSLWLAQYTSDVSSLSWTTATWPQWDLWQFSETGVIPGIDDSYVDLNNFNGTPEEFMRWISVGEPIPVPPHPGKKLVDVTIDTPEGVAVNVTVNGRSTLYQPRRRRRLRRRGPDLIR
jgi:lysozyme